jgi:thiamine-phosphate diphosphorylase
MSGIAGPKQSVCGIYVVTDASGTLGRDHSAIASSAVAGGAYVVQLRDMMLTDRELMEVAKTIRELTSGTDTLFIVNNRADIALAADADGVHLGQDDLTVGAARQILGSDAIIGVSTGGVEEAVQAEADGASYVAIGPIFATATKTDAGDSVGLDAITEIKRAVKVPVVAIGGITQANIKSVAKAGADAAAVVSAVAGAPDMTKAVYELIKAFNSGRKRVSL